MCEKLENVFKTVDKIEGKFFVASNTKSQTFNLHNLILKCPKDWISHSDTQGRDAVRLFES